MQATETWGGFPAHKALRCASLLAIAMGALAAGVMLLQQMPIQYLGPQFSLTGIGIMSLFLVKRGDLREGARALVWGTWLIVSLMAMTGQGMFGPTLLAYPVLILMSGLFLGSKSTAWLAAITGLVVFGAAIAMQAQGIERSGGHITYLLYLEGMLLLVTLLTLQLRRGYHELSQDAHRDRITGLANRPYLLEWLDAALAAEDVRRNTYTMVLVNVDRFRTINLALGHETGDRLLSVYGRLISEALPESAKAARLTGDEFALVLPTPSAGVDRAALAAVAARIQAAVSQQVPIQQGPHVTLTCSIGMTQFPINPSDTRMEVLRRADTALQRAKDAGGGCAEVFEDAMGQQAEQRFNIEAELRYAINHGQLRLFLQSQVNAKGRVVGAECLVRWLHPHKGWILPGAFLDIAEESDLIVDLGTWVMEQACRMQVAMDQLGLGIRLSVNISPRQFMKADFVETVQRILHATGADPFFMTLEVTESLVMKDFEDVVAKMNTLIGRGFSFSLDDFGTGYSSLSYLKRLPVQEIKIARSFIQDAPRNSDDAALVKAILSVAEHLSMQVVAEGVETPSQTEFLEGLGDMLYQGFLFSRPEPSHQWIEHLPTRQPQALANLPHPVLMAAYI